MTFHTGPLKKILLALCIVSFGSAVHAQPKIVIKLDDLDASSSFTVMVPTFDFLAANNIKAGFGAKALLTISVSQIAAIKNYLQKTNAKGEALFEIWNHGLDHTQNNPAGTWEFSGTSYAYQKMHLDSACSLLKSKLGVTAHAFGAPYNQNDTTFMRVMSENPDMKVIMFSQQTPSAASGIMNLKNRVNMESATGVVGYAYFVGNYNAQKTAYRDYMVLQGHPGQWTTDSLKNEFKKIVAFLTAEGCEFVTPYGYYCTVNNITTAPPEPGSFHAAPRSYELLRNYPNPFNPETTIQFSVPTTGHALLKIYNVLGRETATLYNAETKAGILQTVKFEASGLAGGIYFSRLECTAGVQCNRMVLLK